MEKTVKITKRMRFEEIIKIAEELGNQGLVDFAKHEIILLDKKAQSKSTGKNAQEHNELMNKIAENLKTIGRAVTITELQKESKEMAEYSNQKISAMLKKMLDNNTVEKIVDKKKSYFKLAE